MASSYTVSDFRCISCAQIRNAAESIGSTLYARGEADGCGVLRRETFHEGAFGAEADELIERSLLLFGSARFQEALEPWKVGIAILGCGWQVVIEPKGHAGI